MRRFGCSFTLLLAMALFLDVGGSNAATLREAAAPKARWVLSYSNRNPQRYHGLAFPNATLGWMVGDSGSILHSRDAGYTWEPQVSPSTNRLMRVQFVNGRVGWAAGEGNAVLGTRDGGHPWTLQQLPAGPVRRSCMDLHFVDEQEGWIAHNYGGLLHTRDGGRTWTAVDRLAQDALVSVYFMDAKTGWVLSVGGTLLRTADGGQSWVSQQLSPLPHAVAIFSTVFFLDGDHGWIGTDCMISSRSGDAPPLFHTTDGGQTWSVQGRWPGTSVRNVWFHNAQSGWCAEFGGIYSTKDGGSSWMKELDSHGDPFVQIVFVEPSRGWILTFTGNVYTYSKR